MLMVTVAGDMCWMPAAKDHHAAMAHDATVAADAGMGDGPSYHMPLKLGGMAQGLSSRIRTTRKPARNGTGATGMGGAA